MTFTKDELKLILQALNSHWDTVFDLNIIRRAEKFKPFNELIERIEKELE